jgi:hypothetical protein
MQTEQVAASPEFSGKKDQQELARRLFTIFQARGRFFTDYAPIRLTAGQLAEFMASQSGEGDTASWTKRVTEALSASPAVFAKEGTGDEMTFATTRSGRAPVDVDVEGPNRAILISQFTTPQPKREVAQPERRRTPEEMLFRDTLQTDASTTLIWEDITPEDRRGGAAPAPATSAASAPSVAAADEADLVDDELDVLPAVEPAAIGAAVDLASASDTDIADAIRSSLSREISVAAWGDSWMAEDRVQRFSRGDLRRIEEFLREQGGVATDAEIVEDVLGIRAGAAEYEGVRFALNYRLSREAREFEYAGTDTLGVWTGANQQAIGTTKRKPSEIGQDYRFLLDYRTPDEGLEEGIIEHVLSFYEYIYGVLPLDANVATLMPKAGFADQRAARITFESPQTNETVTCELRFPTSNRGGFIAGLEDFFAENLVPGGVVTIEKTDQPNHFLLEYFRVSGEDRKLLHLDERKGKYAFRSTTYYCATQDEFVLSESRFPKLADAKPLDDRVRRKPEQVVSATFERVGENVGSATEPRYWASFDDLLAAANIERPLSAELLRDILTSGTYQEFTVDDSTEHAYFYQPQ